MMNERFLVEQLKDKLEPLFEQVWIHKKPTSSRKFREAAQKIFGHIPILQPEFDLILKTKTGQLNAIEIKYLKMPKKGYNIPYYHGIGQALALSRFGFDHVGLWLFADCDLNVNQINKYGAEAWFFIRNELKLPLEYSYFKIIRNKDKIDFFVMQYTDSQNGYVLKEIIDDDFIITFKYPNQLRLNETSIKMRGLIEEYLNIK
jgi:hypothetical protein